MRTSKQVVFGLFFILIAIGLVTKPNLGWADAEDPSSTTTPAPNDLNPASTAPQVPAEASGSVDVLPADAPAADPLAEAPFADPISQHLLVQIESEPEENLIHEIILGLDAEGDIVQFIRRSAVDQDIFSFNDLADSGVILATAGKLMAVTLHCEGCTATAGGTLELKYLYSFFSKTYRSYKMNLTRSADGWKLSGERIEPVDRLILKARRIFGQVYGIEGVVPSVAR